MECTESKGIKVNDAMADLLKESPIYTQRELELMCDNDFVNDLTLEDAFIILKWKIIQEEDKRRNQSVEAMRKFYGRVQNSES